MTIRQMAYALEAEKTGSLNAAARALFVSQSSLSEAIRDLEGELGVSIFERSHAGITATQEGRAFLDRARPIVSAMDALENSYTKNRQPVSQLRVASVQSSVVPEAFTAFADEAAGKNLRVRLQCVSCQTGEVVESVRAGSADLGIIYCTTRQEQVWRTVFADWGIRINAIFETGLFMILSRDDPLAGRESLGFSDLSDRTFVFSGDSGIDVFSNIDDYAEASFDLPGHRSFVDAQDNLQLITLLERGGCFSIGHRPPDSRHYDRLAYVPADIGTRVKMLALQSRKRSETPEMSRFVSVLKAVVHTISGE